jgi:hypothetical protein
MGSERANPQSETKSSRLKNVNGFLVLDLPSNGRHCTLEDLKQAEDDMDREYVERMISHERQ